MFDVVVGASEMRSMENGVGGDGGYFGWTKGECKKASNLAAMRLPGGKGRQKANLRWEWRVVGVDG